MKWIYFLPNNVKSNIFNFTEHFPPTRILFSSNDIKLNMLCLLKTNFKYNFIPKMKLFPSKINVKSNIINFTGYFPPIRILF